MSSAIGCWLCNLARLSKRVLIPLFSILTLLLSFNTLAVNGPDNAGRADYDLDDNGLIEINDLADLDEIRNNLDGKTLYSSNVGCPDAEDGTVNGGCIGFELKADLDFDTNGNGEIGDGDDYRNITQEGIAEGWEPIGTETVIFSAIFNGNGHVINNLTIDRPATNVVGLFGHIQDARIENLGIVASTIIGRLGVGALVGYIASNSQIQKVSIMANVQGERYVGGVAGAIVSDVQIENVFVSGTVRGTVTDSENIAGVIGSSLGSSSSRNSISRVLSLSTVLNAYYITGIVDASGNADITNSYWATDVSGENTSYNSLEANSYVGLTLAALQCAMGVNTDSNSGCVSVDGSEEGLKAAVVLYKDWDSGVWDFGTNAQLPSLKFNGQVLRDSDGDGVLDDDDVWPFKYAASIDADGDGYPDEWKLGCDDACVQSSGLTLDQFPHHAGAWLDADFDGRPDVVNNACAVDCGLTGLVMDTALGDRDNDGILDAADTDRDGDGITDIDADHDGLVDIVSLDTLNAMRFQLQGVGLKLTGASDLNVSGCPFAIFEGVNQQRCSGYELTQDLDFDTNNLLDDYRNVNDDGLAEGWEPIGAPNNIFSTIFNGNGHVIKNLTINRSSQNFVGLFGAIENARIENVGIVASTITGNSHVGALVGHIVSNSQIKKVSITANVQGINNVGGVVGAIESNAQIEDVFVSGTVAGNQFIAGVVGRSFSSSSSRDSISRVLSLSSVSGAFIPGGIIGHSENSDITNSYWAKDVSGQYSSSGRSEANSYVGLTLATLQCATVENTDSTSGCVSADGSNEFLNAAVVLYKDWSSDVWDFGTAPNASSQVPALKFNGQVLRDNDGDGALDADDVWPNNRAGYQDFDNDGYLDKWALGCDDACIQSSGLTLDQFPHHTWAALDADFDGLPDGAENCVSDCLLGGLTKDGSLGDRDNDGILDVADTDSDGDGITDVDADHDGLIDIDSLDKLNAMRFQLQGVGLKLTETSLLNVSGCPFILFEGIKQQRCSGYELTQDLDFDSNSLIENADDYRNVNGDGIAEGWEPIGTDSNTFGAIFNGNGYVIKNLTINRPSQRYVGLFGKINNARIENVGIVASSIIGDDYVGALVGYIASSQVQKVSIMANIQGKGYVGGVAGQMIFNTQIEDVFVSGAVSGDQNVAGVVGYSPSYSSSPISRVLSLSIVSGTSNTAGIRGYSSLETDITNSYWAKGVSGQNNSDGSSEANSYVGLTLATLQCATAANTDAASGCVSSDGSDEGLNGAVVLYKGWDPAIWDFGIAPNANQQLPGLKFNGQVLRDSDGDGILDGDDLLPFDHDNDDVLDVDDFYPLIAVGSLDTDHDGIPNDCDQACLDLNMVADIDDDNDGVLDGADFYPLISLSGALDSDNDGAPNDCDQACINAGMTADAFASNSAAAIDDDNDGMPDGWSENCLAQCQVDSGLIKDLLLNDTDNDGATNDVDSDFVNDNGKPTLLTAPETMYAAVNTTDGSGLIVDSLTVDSLLSQLTAVDFVDESAALTAKAYLNNVELVRSEEGEVTLPSGLLALNWVAVDSSGNESEPLEQLVYVYPQVRFKSATSITGEASQAEIIVELTGDSPEYPVSIDLTVNDNLSSIDQADLNASFDLAAIHTVVIEAGDDAELLNREASLIIPVVEDGESENDELLVVEFQPALGDQDYHEFILVSNDQKAHELTVTYQNLAPSVQLLVLQDEQAVTSISMDGGVVSLLAIVSDGNGLDEHAYNWDLDGLTTEDLTVSSITFEPSDFAVREYFVSVTVTDNGSNPLSGVASQKLTLVSLEEPPVTEPPANPSSGEAASSGGSSGGGAMAWILLLLMTLAVVGQYRRNAKIEKYLF